MTPSQTDRELIEHVQRQINSGTKRIVLPLYLVNGASDEALEEIRRLCLLTGVTIELKV